MTNRPNQSIISLGGDIIHKFDSFDEQRKRDLINRGFEEFGRHGYKRASLNKILTNSSIPKGLFYHYFSTKKELYKYLYEYGINVITKRLVDSSILEETDYIERLIKSYMIKVEVYHDFQYFEQFLMQVYRDNNEDFLQTIQLQESKEYGHRFVTEHIDHSLFRVSDLSVNTRVASRYMQQSFNDIINSIHSMSKEEILQYLCKEASYVKQVLYKEDSHD